MPRRRASPPRAAVPLTEVAAPAAAADGAEVAAVAGATPVQGVFEAGGASYAPVAQAGFQTLAMRVQEVHQTISRKTFHTLGRLPGLSAPARLVQGAHDALTQGVYAAVRHGGGALIQLAGRAEHLATDAERVPGRRESAVRSALNAVAGDRLADRGSALAIRMGLYADGDREPLVLDRLALAFLRPRVCVFIHGLGCDEHSWHRHPSAWDSTEAAGADRHYGGLLARDAGVTPLYLRYNTGRTLADNGLELALLLSGLHEAAASALTDIVLVGHSMGGLVARLACGQAAAEAMPWLRQTSLLVCLGSPHQGAPLERLGHLTSQVLGLSDLTRPLQALADARSRGVQDLRHGLRDQEGAGPLPAGLALRLVAGSLSGQAGDRWPTIVGRVLGDGLVTSASAADPALAGDVERVELAGLGHMDLLNHPRVYALLRRWVDASGLSLAGRAA